MNQFLDLWAQAHIAAALDMEPKEIQHAVVRTMKTDVLVMVTTYKFGLKAEARISKRVMGGDVVKAVKAYCAAIERIIKKLKAQLTQKALSGELDKPEPAPQSPWTWPQQWPQTLPPAPVDPPAQPYTSPWVTPQWGEFTPTNGKWVSYQNVWGNSSTTK